MEIPEKVGSLHTGNNNNNLVHCFLLTRTNLSKMEPMLKKYSSSVLSEGPSTYFEEKFVHYISLKNIKMRLKSDDEEVHNLFELASFLGTKGEGQMMYNRS